jgi:ABC-type uncharacterized transport system substrate-binding protein
MRLLAAIALALLAQAGAAMAHPHVWVTSKSEVVYDGKGGILGVRQIWTFDEMFSAFATQGLDTNKDGVLSRDELKDLAQTNVTSLKDFDYFTYAKLSGKKLLFKPPEDYWLEFKDKVLTLHFFLPFMAPQMQGKRVFALEVFDPTYFVDFEMAEQDPVVLVAAPGCAVDIHRPAPLSADQVSAAASLDQNAFDPVATGFGAQFSNSAVIVCP